MSVILHYNDGIYTTDYDGSRDADDKDEIILLKLVRHILIELEVRY